MAKATNCLLFIASLAIIMIVGCKKNNPAVVPTVTTAGITNIGISTASCGGTITSNGGATITASGICWSHTNNSPSITTDSVASGATAAGSYTLVMNNLLSNTTYYARAYATNSAGTGYGSVVTFSTSVDTTKVTFMYSGQSVTYGIVISPTTGRKWMDRDLGASRAATAFNDSLAYGDLFEWGRLDDGHQKRNSDTTSVWATTPVPGNSLFIVDLNNPANPYADWLIPPSNTLWQGSHGINNPCPEGWYVPTQTDWLAETGITDTATAFGQLRLTVSGYRNFDGSLGGRGKHGQWWTSTPDGTTAAGDDNVYLFKTGPTYATATTVGSKAAGASVRCIRD